MNIRIRNIAIILVVVLLAGTIWIFNSSGQPVHSDSPAVGKFTAAAQDAEEGSYEAYLKQHGDAPRPDREIRIEGESYSPAAEMSLR